jgi:hypothetical protein
MHYLADLETALHSSVADEDLPPLFAASPERIYPVNLMNLSRMDEVGEIALYRYSMHTLLTVTREAAAKQSEKSAAKSSDKNTVLGLPRKNGH